MEPAGSIYMRYDVLTAVIMEFPLLSYVMLGRVVDM
jgi:hypothetical protein